MKNKKVDALQHKELIGDEFEIQYIINSNGESPMTINKLAEIVNKLIITVDKGFKQVNARIDNLVKKNNLKE